MTVIECRHLEKRYKNGAGVKDADFTIQENTITGIVGRNGTGKTTLLKTIAGYLKKTGGEVSVFGENPFNSLNVSANSMYLDEYTMFSNALTTKDILDHHGRFYPNWDAGLAQRLADYFSIPMKVGTDYLSKGQKNTFYGILGLAARCPLTIFDEPTTGMDASVRKDFYRALLKDYLAHPRTILISSHHLDEIDELIEDLLLIDGGRSVLHLPVEEVKEYAMSVSGPSLQVKQWSDNQEVIVHLEDKGGLSTVIVKNHFTAAEKAAARDLRFTPVSASDLCVYLTRRNKGGIDDVFSDSQHG
ncbi:ATP-binding cassette domain-containing protein [Jeotgalibacillus salarius]|uniref:ABC transporter ATP-binding protein n=1 Tax=Jeotgalibacillus salarius TaxID=546023 RepID=A0A4Y8LHW5_9BACL|nr:ABC transporter ATP-binding protein [Jeotgalibacillus salarius]TFE02068.1 ABC transporter ATP-binding protein [Jeotgalibacillus salarius]